MTPFRRWVILVLATLALVAATFGVVWLYFQLLDTLPLTPLAIGWAAVSTAMVAATFLIMRRLGRWLRLKQDLHTLDSLTQLRKRTMRSWHDLDGPVGKARNG